MTLPRLYRDLTEWWPLLSAPTDYAEEAEVYRRVLTGRARIPVHTVLELGCGGGNNASHLARHFTMTLTDRSPGMLAVARRLVPQADHAEGDMRTIRLGTLFDAVFVHDAVAYLTTEEDLEAAIATAAAHTRPGGVTLFVPDFTAETFRPGTDTGGHDGPDGRALRYLEWTRDPDRDDTTYIADMVYLLRVGDEVEAVHDRHTLGVFPEATWLRLLEQAGLESGTETTTLATGETLHMFTGVRS
jgi:SAM-dependent methyltransferase